MARPTSYKPEYAIQAQKLTKFGAIDTELADFFGVTEKTIYTWKKKHPEFVQALKTGKEESDTHVKQALYHRAIGYSHPDTHISNYQGKITKTDITKHYPPDPVSCIFWLKNRDPANWRANPDPDQDSTPPPLNISFEVKGAKGDIKITNAES